LQSLIASAGGAKSITRKIAQPRISFLINLDEGAVPNSSITNSANGGTAVNYLIKMKTDTGHFHKLEIAKYFNFCDRTKSDPFLISPGMVPMVAPPRQLAAGSGFSAM
jgi:hypothetical protein